MCQISTINYKLFKILAMYSWFKGLQLHVYKSIYIYIYIYIYTYMYIYILFIKMYQQ